LYVSHTDLNSNTQYKLFIRIFRYSVRYNYIIDDLSGYKNIGYIALYYVRCKYNFKRVTIRNLQTNLTRFQNLFYFNLSGFQVYMSTRLMCKLPVTEFLFPSFLIIIFHISIYDARLCKGGAQWYCKILSLYFETRTKCTK